MKLREPLNTEELIETPVLQSNMIYEYNENVFTKTKKATISKDDLKQKNEILSKKIRPENFYNKSL